VNKSMIIKIIFSFALIILMLLNACDSSSGEDKKEDSKSIEPSVYVKTVTLHPKSFIDNIEVLGVAKAQYEAKLSSDEGGKIKEFVKDKGSFVNKGDVILVMDNDVLKANLDAALAQYERAESTYVKQEQVYKEKVTSELTYLNSKFERDATKANYDLNKARYERTFIKAPFSGTVNMKYTEIGETVLPGAPIVSMVSMGKIKIEAGVPENYVNDVKIGNNVEVVFKDLDSSKYSSKISYVGQTITTDNRTFPVEILLDNSNRKIKPELSARLFIERKHYEKVFVVPAETVTETDLGPSLFVEKDGVAKMRIVDVISRSENEVAIKSGINDGENLIVVGFQNLIEGEKVTVIE
jgi:membrane fusion protein (multidrug efflux system)